MSTFNNIEKFRSFGAKPPTIASGVLHELFVQLDQDRDNRVVEGDIIAFVKTKGIQIAQEAIQRAFRETKGPYSGTGKISLEDLRAACVVRLSRNVSLILRSDGIPHPTGQIDGGYHYQPKQVRDFWLQLLQTAFAGRNIFEYAADEQRPRARRPGRPEEPDALTAVARNIALTGAGRSTDEASHFVNRFTSADDEAKADERPQSSPQRQRVLGLGALRMPNADTCPPPVGAADDTVAPLSTVMRAAVNATLLDRPGTAPVEAEEGRAEGGEGPHQGQAQGQGGKRPRVRIMESPVRQLGFKDVEMFDSLQRAAARDSDAVLRRQAASQAVGRDVSDMGMDELGGLHNMALSASQVLENQSALHGVPVTDATQDAAGTTALHVSMRQSQHRQGLSGGQSLGQSGLGSIMLSGMRSWDDSSEPGGFGGLDSSMSIDFAGTKASIQEAKQRRLRAKAARPLSRAAVARQEREHAKRLDSKPDFDAYLPPKPFVAGNQTAVSAIDPLPMRRDVKGGAVLHPQMRARSAQQQHRSRQKQFRNREGTGTAARTRQYRAEGATGSLVDGYRMDVQPEVMPVRHTASINGILPPAPRRGGQGRPSSSLGSSRPMSRAMAAAEGGRMRTGRITASLKLDRPRSVGQDVIASLRSSISTPSLGATAKRLSGSLNLSNGGGSMGGESVGEVVFPGNTMGVNSTMAGMSDPPSPVQSRRPPLGPGDDLLTLREKPYRPYTSTAATVRSDMVAAHAGDGSVMPALAVDDTSSDESDDDEVQARQRRRRRSDGAFKQTIRPEDAQTRRAAVAQERLRAEGPWEGPPPAASGRTELDHRTSGEARGWGQGFSLLQRTGGATFAAEQRRAEQQRKISAIDDRVEGDLRLQALSAQWERGEMFGSLSGLSLREQQDRRLAGVKAEQDAKKMERRRQALQRSRARKQQLQAV